MVYKTPDVQFTKIKYDSSANEICHRIHANPFNPDSYLFFVIYVTVLCEPCFNADAVRSNLHLRLYVPVDFIHDIFTFIFLCFSRFFKNKNHSRYHVIYVTKKIPCYQSSFVVPPIVIETTTAGKVN